MSAGSPPCQSEGSASSRPPGLSDLEQLPPSAYGPEEIERHFNNFDVERGRYRFILDELRPRSRILEVGCFLGRYTNHFREIGHDPVGVDISSSVIEKGRELFPDLDLRVVGDTWPSDLQRGDFDAVVASEVIEHVLHPRLFLQNLARCLKPDGRLLLTTQNSNAIHYRLQMLMGRFRWDPTHLRLYSRPELEAELAGGGFEVLRAKGIAIHPKGPQKVPRLFAHYAARLYPNFCWTWGMVARPAGKE